MVCQVSGGEMQIVERAGKVLLYEAAPASWSVVSDIFTAVRTARASLTLNQATNGETFTYHRQ